MGTAGTIFHVDKRVGATGGVVEHALNPVDTAIPKRS